MGMLADSTPTPSLLHSGPSSAMLVQLALSPCHPFSSLRAWPLGTQAWLPDPLPCDLLPALRPLPPSPDSTPASLSLPTIFVCQGDTKHLFWVTFVNPPQLQLCSPVGLVTAPTRHRAQCRAPMEAQSALDGAVGDGGLLGTQHCSLTFGLGSPATRRSPPQSPEGSVTAASQGPASANAKVLRWNREGRKGTVCATNVFLSHWKPTISAGETDKCGARWVQLGPRLLGRLL